MDWLWINKTLNYINSVVSCIKKKNKKNKKKKTKKTKQKQKQQQQQLCILTRFLIKGKLYVILLQKQLFLACSWIWFWDISNFLWLELCNTSFLFVCLSQLILDRNEELIGDPVILFCLILIFLWEPGMRLLGLHSLGLTIYL